MSLGSLILQVRQKYQHGFQTAHFRDSVRFRILDTQPIPDTTDHTCEIHVFTCAKDWLNLVWTVKTFYHYSNRHYALCIHDDGTLIDSDRVTLQHHFPNARLIDRPSANAEKLHYEKQALLEFKKVRIIAGGGGRKPKLSIKEQIILTLVYLRHLTTFQLLGIQFGVSESTANDTFNYWLPLLRQLLPSK